VHHWIDQARESVLVFFRPYSLLKAGADGPNNRPRRVNAMLYPELGRRGASQRQHD
jgi:hypothetical protein